MWFASITISKFSCLFLSLKQYVDILNSSYWIILTLLYLLVLLSCFDCFLSYFVFFIFVSWFLSVHLLIYLRILLSSFIMISIELWRARIGLHSLSKSSNFPRTSSDSLSWPRLHLSSYFLFFLPALSILFSLLAVSK